MRVSLGTTGDAKDAWRIVPRRFVWKRKVTTEEGVTGLKIGTYWKQVSVALDRYCCGLVTERKYLRMTTLVGTFLLPSVYQPKHVCNSYQKEVVSHKKPRSGYPSHRTLDDLTMHLLMTITNLQHHLSSLDLLQPRLKHRRSRVIEEKQKEERGSIQNKPKPR